MPSTRGPARPRPALPPIAGAVLELQRLAGNRAVSSQLGAMRGGRLVVAVSHATTEHPARPPGGIAEIRRLKGGQGLLGRTITSIEPAPPLLRPEAPARVERGWVCRSRPSRVPEPDFEVHYPTPGRHELAPGIELDLDEDWSSRLHEGEKEHVEDGELAWQLTWALVGRIVEELSREPGPPMPSPDGARADLWRRFLRRLPEDLRPGGAAPSEESQQAIWGMEPRTLFRRLLAATTLRDTRGWHGPDPMPREVSREREIKVLEKGRSRIGEVTSEALLAEVRRSGSARAGR